MNSISRANKHCRNYNGRGCKRTFGSSHWDTFKKNLSNWVSNHRILRFFTDRITLVASGA